MEVKYANRNNDEILFEQVDDKTIFMSGYFPGTLRMGEENDRIIMVDPSGGPYLIKGLNMKDFGLVGIIKDFEFEASKVKINLI